MQQIESKLECQVVGDDVGIKIYKMREGHVQF